jgi:protein-S-isoprenylcysteine O-methyltransferase Ste14
VAESIAALGLILLHFSPQSMITGVILLAVQMQRVIYEERVLLNAFPEYAAYAATVPRFIPGLSYRKKSA